MTVRVRVWMCTVRVLVRQVSVRAGEHGGAVCRQVVELQDVVDGEAGRMKVLELGQARGRGEGRGRRPHCRRVLLLVVQRVLTVVVVMVEMKVRDCLRCCCRRCCC